MYIETGSRWVQYIDIYIYFSENSSWLPLENEFLSEKIQ